MARRRALSEEGQRIRDELLGQFRLSVDDLAGILNVDRSTIYRYVQDGRLVALKIGREYRFTEPDVRAFIQSLREQGRRQPEASALRYSPQSRLALAMARGLAAAAGRQAVEPADLLLGCLGNLGRVEPTSLLPDLPWDTGREAVEQELDDRFQERIAMSPESQAVLNEWAPRVAAARQAPAITSAHILLGLLEQADPGAMRALTDLGIDPVTFRAKWEQR